MVFLKKLILFSTPIGNLKDVTLNFLEKANEVDVFLAEKISRTLKLLNYYKINKKILSYHESDWYKRQSKILSLIGRYEKIGFMSGAGTPNIEDPPINLVKYAIENGIEVELVPGVSSLCSAMSLSPLPHTPFLFLGFLDKKNKYIEILSSCPNYVKSIVFFESCHRIKKTLNNMKQIFPNRSILILHELTKVNQKVIFSKLKELKEDQLPEKGEYTIILYNQP